MNLLSYPTQQYCTRGARSGGLTSCDLYYNVYRVGIVDVVAVFVVVVVVVGIGVVVVVGVAVVMCLESSTITPDEEVPTTTAMSRRDIDDANKNDESALVALNSPFIECHVKHEER